MYFIKTPFWLRLIYRSCIWRKPNQDRVLYLSFDDGPHPEATPFVLEQLAIFNAKASFFCIGKNVQLYPEIYTTLMDANHTVGNHTQNHMNGWKNNTANYIEDIQTATKSINSHLFRPPYGKIRFAQIKALRSNLSLPQDIIMWDVLSADFDTSISPEKCLENVLKNVKSGSIIVFHDSIKAFPNLEYTLPKALQYWAAKGFVCDAIK